MNLDFKEYCTNYYSNLYGFIRRFIWRGGQEIRHNLRELERTQWLSKQEIEELQLKKIQRLVAYAYENVPFYRDRYRSEDIHPRDIMSIKDFQKIPFLSRHDIINHFDKLVSTKYEGATYEDKTGGSTGRPMRFLMDRSTALWSAAVETRCRGWYGVKLGEKRAWIWGNPKDFPNWHWKDRLAARAKRYRYLNAITMVKQKMQVFAEMLVKWQPAMIRAYASAIAVFAQFLKETGITGIHPKLIETTGEKLTFMQRRLVEEVFKAPVAEHYSSYEIYSIAYQCSHGNLHVCEDRFLELVTNGQIVQPGQVGEVVLTSLNQYAMPFIRYKNEDLGILDSNTCSCGRGMPVIRDIVGRKIDLLSRPDGQFVSGFSVHPTIKKRPEVVQFQAYQKDLRHLEIRLKCNQKVDSQWTNNLIDELQPLFGKEMEINVKLVDNIELTPAGKHRYVISEIIPNFN